MHAGGFKLQQRAVHVYAEAARVPEFKAVCDRSAPAEEKVAALGRLMDASQASCRCCKHAPCCRTLSKHHPVHRVIYFICFRFRDKSDWVSWASMLSI